MKIVLGAIASIVVVLFGYVSMQPSEYKISRELMIGSTPDVIFPFLNNSQKADSWMPWAEQDPNMKMSYSGPEEGVGSTSRWESTGQMGMGEAVVIESVPNEMVKTQLTYTKPMEMSQVAILSITPVGDGSLVRWSVEGKNSFFGKFIHLFMNMEKMVGGEFENGLGKLKSLVEQKSAEVNPAAEPVPGDAPPAD